MEKRWSKAEISHLKRNAAAKSHDELARRFHTDAETVRRKLAELGLTGASPLSEAKAALERFSDALELLHERQWSAAAAAFEAVVAEGDGRQLMDRARQYLAVCRRRQAAEEPAQEDPYLRAVFEKNRGNLTAAFELCRQLGEADRDERVSYLMASLQALSGAEEEALRSLATAIRLESKNRVHAYHDPDFATIKGREEFTKLLADS